MQLAVLLWHVIFSNLCLLRRGINPPHRVKSISMTSFSEKEITHLKEGGNEVSFLRFGGKTCSITDILCGLIPRGFVNKCVVNNDAVVPSFHL